MNSKYKIRKMDAEAIEKSGALDLVWRVFLQFEAPEYAPEGVAVFKDYIKPQDIRQKVTEGALFFWGCFDEETLIGVIAVRQPCHISLLFVDKAYQRQGVARALYQTVIDDYKKENEALEITVNSSPYAEKAYGRLGFVPTKTEQVVSGIRFIPMKHSIKA